MAVYGEFCARSASRLSALGCMHTFMSRLCSHANYEDSCKTAVSNKQQQYDYETSRNGSEAETRSETLATRLETHSGGGVVAQYSG